MEGREKVMKGRITGKVRKGRQIYGSEMMNE
jgi:hypothetical protein